MRCLCYTNKAQFWLRSLHTLAAEGYRYAQYFMVIIEMNNRTNPKIWPQDNQTSFQGVGFDSEGKERGRS